MRIFALFDIRQRWVFPLVEDSRKQAIAIIYNLGVQELDFLGGILFVDQFQKVRIYPKQTPPRLCAIKEFAKRRIINREEVVHETLGINELTEQLVLSFRHQS